MSMILFLLASASIDVTVIEKAGLRRFGYPMHVRLALPADLKEKERFRLKQGERTVPAQFTPDGKRSVWVDFNVNLAPLEEQKFRVEWSETLPPPPETKEAVRVTQDDKAFTVRSGGMTYVVPADLAGFLGPVTGGKSRYTAGGGRGLWRSSDTGEPRFLSGLKGSIERQGSHAAVLQFEGKGATVRLTFPRSKSWVEVQMDCAEATSVGAELPLELTGPGLVDFGAGDGVYVALKAKQVTSLEATTRPRTRERSWTMLLDGKPYAVGMPGSPQASLLGGWAHLMDRSRCTALAIDGFGSTPGRDTITLSAEGSIRWKRDRSSMRFWLHFVPMPVQVGALTSPQSMREAPVVKVGPVQP
jgi:hypothetical protein